MACGITEAQFTGGLDPLHGTLPARHSITSCTIMKWPNQRVEFGPGCQGLLRRCSPARPVFICELLTPREAIEVVKTYLLDAAISLAEGRGPLLAPL
jgi:hypothetical protein